jgi:Co/Zn/Cd efflux system component
LTSSTPTRKIDELWDFSEEEIRRGIRERRSPLQEDHLSKTMRGDPPDTLLYAVLCSIYEGNDTPATLYEQLDSMFVVRLGRMTISPVDIDVALQHGSNEGLIEYANKRLSLTSKGANLLRTARKHLLHEGYWMKRFLTERNVVITSGLILILLVIVKLWVGFSIMSHAMVTDGFENLTDLIVVGIIALSLKNGKDRLGAIAIMIFMLVSGALLGFNAFISLLSPEVITTSYWGYIVAILSIVLNLGLIYYKTLVGRMTGNLALISDAKEDGSHIRIGCGVLIGLLFAEVGIYVVDSIVAILIALVVIWEGIEALRELLEAGDNLSVDTIHLAASDQYDDLITHWILAHLARGPSSEEELTKRFLRGVTLGYRYYDVHAVIGFKDLEQKGISKHIRIAERSGLLARSDENLSITNNGLILFYKQRVNEIKLVKKQFSKTHNPWIAAGYALFGLTAFMLLVLYGESIYLWFVSLLHALVGIV